jgi:phosphatidylglycerol:prolipoprotein diacylglycerol transferase
MFPTLFKIGFIEIRVYSLMYLIAILLTIYFAKKRANSLDINKDLIENAIIFTFLGAIIGARAYYVILRWDYYSQNPSEIYAIWHGGLAIHGAIIAGFLSALVYCKYKKFNFLKFTDLTLPFLLLGQGIGRFGNFANGEAHGVPTIIPPEIIFRVKNIFPEFWQTVLNNFHLVNRPESISKLNDIIHKTGEVIVLFKGKEYVLKEYVPWGISFTSKYMPPAYLDFGTLPVHPTFFYEMILNFIGAAFLIYLWKKDDLIGKGYISCLYLIFYGLFRGFVTTFRADDLMIGLFRAPHILSIFLITVGIICLSIFYSKNKKY